MDRKARKSAKAVDRILKAALPLFSRQGYRATSMRQVATRARLSLGNLYHHFGSKERIFERLLCDYWDRLGDPALPLNKVFYGGGFPDDLEKMAAAIEQVVEENRQSILLIYIDVIEFRGKHLKEFYGGMAGRFESAYGERLRTLKSEGRLGDVDPMVGVMVAARWLFYFFTIEKCFGVPMHFGMTPDKAVGEFIRILRLGVLPRVQSEAPMTSTSKAMVRNPGPGRHP